MSEEVKSTLISFCKDYIKFLGSIVYRTYYQEVMTRLKYICEKYFENKST